MKQSKADREQLIHERALKIQREQGSDVYQAEDYHALAKRLIEEEEKTGLPVNPYPLNQESTEGGAAKSTPRRDKH